MTPAQRGTADAWCALTRALSRALPPQVAGNGAIIAKNMHKFRGVVNGIDPEIWDPMDDRLLPRFYGAAEAAEGKAAARAALRQRLGLQVADDRPVVGVVTRLTGQKGALAPAPAPALLPSLN